LLQRLYSVSQKIRSQLADKQTARDDLLCFVKLTSEWATQAQRGTRLRKQQTMNDSAFATENTWGTAYLTLLATFTVKYRLQQY